MNSTGPSTLPWGTPLITVHSAHWWVCASYMTVDLVFNPSLLPPITCYVVLLKLTILLSHHLHRSLRLCTSGLCGAIQMLYCLILGAVCMTDVFLWSTLIISAYVKAAWDYESCRRITRLQLNAVKTVLLSACNIREEILPPLTGDLPTSPSQVLTLRTDLPRVGRSPKLGADIYCKGC